MMDWRFWAHYAALGIASAAPVALGIVAGASAASEVWDVAISCGISAVLFTLQNLRLYFEAIDRLIEEMDKTDELAKKFTDFLDRVGGK